MRRNDNGCVLADVSGGFLCTGHYDERTKASEIHVFAVRNAVLDNSHKLFDTGNNRSLVDAGCLCDFTRYFKANQLKCTENVQKNALYILLYIFVNHNFPLETIISDSFISVRICLTRRVFCPLVLRLGRLPSRYSIMASRLAPSVPAFLMYNYALDSGYQPFSTQKNE